MITVLVRALSIAVVVAGLLSRPASAQSPPATSERSIIILVTKDRLHISTDGNMPAGASPKDLEGDGLLIRCKTCDLNRNDGEKKTLTFRCQGDVMVENSLFIIRAETVTCEGTQYMAVGTSDKDAELWTGADKKKTAFTLGRKIRFDVAKRSVEVDEASVLKLTLLAR